ncbi:MAG: hypothetical protein U9P72_08225 [Campylobacterota bacterium]|nr:hypothetical protein [Campylobacterota bacterium]
MNRIWLLIFVMVIFNACSVEEGSSSMEPISSELPNQESGLDSDNEVSSNDDIGLENLNDSTSLDGGMSSGGDVSSDTQTNTEPIINVDDEAQTDAPPPIPDGLSGLGS